MEILTIVGSLSPQSLNRRLLEAASELAPPGVAFAHADLRPLPFYEPALDVDEARPAAVHDLRAAVGRASGVLIATPEYNYGVPGVLKNALDWASRPAYRSVFAHKPVGIVSASPSPVGGARAQGQLKQNLLGMAADVFPHAELAIGSATGRFDAAGRLVDEEARSRVAGFMDGFVKYLTRRSAA